MIKLTSRGAAVAVAGSALALAGGLLPAQAATSGWRIDATYAVRNSVNIYTSVSASSPADAWATGLVAKAKGDSLPQFVMRHWTGKTWRLVTLPAKVGRAWAKTDPFFSQVGVASARNLWVFGGLGGSYLRLNGNKWTTGRLPGGGSATSATPVEIDAVKVLSSTDAWAFGGKVSFNGTQEVSAPYAAHYNGDKWSRVSVPGSGAITAVAAASSGELWAVEGGLTELGVSISSGPTPPVVVQWTASSGWQNAADQPSLAASDQLTSVVAEPSGDVWFGGSAKNKAKGTTPLAAEWNGTAWSVSDLPMKASKTDWQLTAMAPDGTGGVWAAAQASSGNSARIFHLHGARWSQVSPAFGKRKWILEALAEVPGTDSVWGVGAVEVGKSGADGLIAVDGPLPR